VREVFVKINSDFRDLLQVLAGEEVKKRGADSGRRVLS
jgi:hypothetical protein